MPESKHQEQGGSQIQGLDLCNVDRYANPEDLQKLYEDLATIKARRRAALEHAILDRRPIGAVALLDTEIVDTTIPTALQ